MLIQGDKTNGLEKANENEAWERYKFLMSKKLLNEEEFLFCKKMHPRRTIEELQYIGPDHFTGLKTWQNKSKF